MLEGLALHDSVEAVKMRKRVCAEQTAYSGACEEQRPENTNAQLTRASSTIACAVGYIKVCPK